MTFSTSKLWATVAAAATLAALAGCSGAESDYAAAPPPPPPAYAPPPPVELAGAPPAYSDGLAGGPPPREVSVSAGMSPIANPLDLPPAERHRGYGAARSSAPRRAAAPAVRAAAPAALPAPAPARPAAARPAPVKPAAPILKPAPAKPVVAAKAPVNAKPVLKTPPVLTPAAPAPKLDARTARLQGALTAPVIAGSTMTVAPSITTGQPGAVVLTLPKTLFDLIKEQAAKAGLTRAARTADVSATLTGQGYSITPNGAQTARLKSGEAPTFQWQVAPLAGAEHSPLRAQVDAILRGERNTRTFSLAAFEQAVKIAIPEPVRKGFSLPKIDLGKLGLGGIKLPDYGEIDVPGIGKTSSRTVIGAGLVLLALVLLIAIATRAAEAKARAKRRRKFRTMADYGTMDAEPEYASTTTVVHPAPEPVHHVEPAHHAAVETTTTYAQAEPVAVVHRDDDDHTVVETKSEAEMTDDERKANWPWRKDEEHRETEKV